MVGASPVAPPELLEELLLEELEELLELLEELEELLELLEEELLDELLEELLDELLLELPLSPPLLPPPPPQAVSRAPSSMDTIIWPGVFIIISPLMMDRYLLLSPSRFIGLLQPGWARGAQDLVLKITVPPRSTGRPALRWRRSLSSG